MLNPQEEAEFKKLKDKCRDLKVPAPMDIFIGLQVHDHAGVLVFDDLQRGHSWTRNWYNWSIFSSCYFTNSQSSFGAGYASIKRGNASIAGTYFGLNYHGVYPGIANSDTYGIQVGTGNAAFSAEQYALDAIISNGMSSGQLSYQATPATTAVYDNTPGAEKWTCTQSRIFNNNSGASITVKETGITSYNLGTTYLIERSVLDPEVTVANGAQLTVTYNFSMDFSAID